MFRCAASLTLTAVAVLALSACHSPKGGIMPYTGGTDVFYSGEYLPATITLMDTRTDEVIFAIDVPTGQQIVLQFLDGEGDDPVYAPDLMMYELMERGTSFGKLRNAITVPSADVRRIDVNYRPGPENRPEQEDMQYATEDSEAPEWWSNEGGRQSSESPAVNIYDD